MLIRLAAFTAPLAKELRALVEAPGGARIVVGKLAVALQASLLLQHGHPAVAEAFIASVRRRKKKRRRVPPGRRGRGGGFQHEMKNSEQELFGMEK